MQPIPVNYQRGFRRLWLVGFFAWFLFAITFYGEDIDDWLDENIFKVGVLLFWPIAVYPLGHWIIQGFASQSSRGSVRVSVHQNFRALVARHPAWANISSKKGMLRLWLVVTIVWYLYAIAVSAFPIAEWVGFQSRLLKETGSISSARERIEKIEAVIAACQVTINKICWTPDPDAPFGMRHISNCEQMPAFNTALNYEAKANGIDIPPSGLRGEGCLDLVETHIPKIDWVLLFVVGLTPFLPAIVYLIGRWIIMGFIRGNEKSVQG